LDSRIRESRRARHITLQVLSAETSLSTGFLSKLERGEASASIANLISISKYLGLSLQDLFQAGTGEIPAVPDYVLSKAKERNDSPPLPAVGYTFHRSCGDLPDQQLAAFELEFPANQENQPVLVAHEGEEVLYMLEGKLEFQIGDATLVLERGDCVHFDCENRTWVAISATNGTAVDGGFQRLANQAPLRKKLSNPGITPSCATPSGNSCLRSGFRLPVCLPHHHLMHKCQLQQYRRG